MSVNDQVLSYENADHLHELGGDVAIFSDKLPSGTGFLAVGRFQPGEGLRPHRHRPPGEEFYFVTRGTAKVWFGDEDAILPAGSCFHIPAGVRHGVMNPGDELLEVVFAIAPKECAEPVDVEDGLPA
jgi:quercetin dioxygenase-like cupin family protein